MAGNTFKKFISNTVYTCIVNYLLFPWSLKEREQDTCILEGNADLV